MIGVMRRVFAVGSLCGLAACSANSHSIFRTTELDDGRSLITDAEQRLILNSKPRQVMVGQIIPSRVVCAEPSPDVAQAISSAFSADAAGSIVGKGSLSADVAASVAESIAELGKRLATVQALRDASYRACEAYANGALTATSYAMILSAYDDLLETTLLAELMTSGGHKGATIGGNASGTSESSTSQSFNISTPVSVNEAAETTGAAEEGAAAGEASPAPATTGEAAPGGTATASGGSEAKGKSTVNVTTNVTPSESSAGAASPEVAKAIQTMHLQALEHDRRDRGAILAACVAALDRHGAGQPTQFETLCATEIFPTISRIAMMEATSGRPVPLVPPQQ
jgi:hypothetical protein